MYRTSWIKENIFFLRRFSTINRSTTNIECSIAECSTKTDSTVPSTAKDRCTKFSISTFNWKSTTAGQAYSIVVFKLNGGRTYSFIKLLNYSITTNFFWCRLLYKRRMPCTIALCRILQQNYMIEAWFIFEEKFSFTINNTKRNYYLRFWEILFTD